MENIEDDQTENLANGFDFVERYENNHVQCQEKGCTNAGSVQCILPGNFNDETNKLEPDTHEYFCAQHAGDNGYCHCCGTFIAGWIDFGTLCDNCRAELDYNDRDFDDDY